MSLLPAVAGVIGWPVAHSKSPLIHRFWLQALGLDGDYSRFPVAPERLGAFVQALPAMGLRGVNVTVPHKLAVMAHLDEVDDLARAVGAVNTVVVEGERLCGTNTDVEGIEGPCRAHGVLGGAAWVVGSGGAARAAVMAATRLGADVTVLARDMEKAAAMLAGMGVSGRVAALGAPLPAAGDVRLLFNATSLGMKGQAEMDLDVSALPDGCVVFDAVYAPLETGLLRAARARGLAAIDGLEMLVGQAARAFRLFYGAAPPRARDAELRARLLA
jgi:shikimate dehydrogenase